MADIRTLTVDGTTYNIKDATARADITNLKSALTNNVKDIATPYGKNIFDDRRLEVGNIKNTGFHQYTGTAREFYNQFDSALIPVNGAETTVYKLTFEAFVNESNSGIGIQFKYVYTDDTESVCVSCPNTTTTKTAFTATLSSTTKTLKGIKITFGSNGNSVWTISNVMVCSASDASITDFIPYLTAYDKEARDNINTINTELEYIDDINHVVVGVLNIDWITCDIEMSTSGWVYYKRTIGANARRIAPAEGHPIKLHEGDTIGLSDYTDATYYLGWRVGTVYYTSDGWLTSDTVAPVDGEYCVLIKHLDNRLISSINELSSLFKYDCITLSEEISNLNSLIGTGPASGYTYYGEKISISGYKFSANNLNISIGQGQDCVVYDHYAISFSADTGLCKVTDIDTGTVVSSFQMPTVNGTTPHFNSAVWGDTYNNADIPLLYVNVNTPNATSPGLCAVYQLSVSGTIWNATLVQTIDVSFVGDTEWGTLSKYDAVSFAVFNSKLYAFGASSEKKKTHVCSFAIPSHTSDVTLTRTDIIDSFDIVYMSVIQGCMVNGSKLYILDGLGTVNNGTADLYVVDLVKGIVGSYLDLSLVFTGEPEFIFVYDGEIIFGGFKMIVLRI